MTYRPYRSAYTPISGRLDRSRAPGLDLALLAYGLFAIGFVLPITVPVGIVLAYAGRTRGGPLARAHFERQIALFWRSMLVLLAVAVLHAMVVGFGAITFGFGLVMMVIPWALGLGWLVWAVWMVATGLLTAWRGQFPAE